jgi:UDP-N-acetylmuramate: L-alanyl-gamma-D-glutamyl-meso-diaminopimelate ligase
VQLAIAGEHNALNATAAIAAAHAAAIPLDQALAAISSFRPPKRRLELLAELGGIRLIDDFAHHPTAIEQTLRTLRSLVPSGGRLIACVEPRSNTMVRTVFATELSAALALADRVLLGAIDRPERFQAGEALDIATLCRTIRERGADANGPLTPEQIETQVTADWRAGDCIVVMSNGAFGGLAQRLRQRLQR